MHAARLATLALTLIAAISVDAAPAAAGVSTGQHRSVMNNIARAQRRNNAVVNSVQRNIRRQSGY